MSTSDDVHVPWDLSNWGEQRLTGLEPSKLRKMCKERGLGVAELAQRATCVRELLAWKQEQGGGGGGGGNTAPEAQPAKKAKTGKRAKKLEEFLKEHGAEKLDRKTQLVSYMGNCTEALAYFKGKNKVTRYMLRNYFKTQTGQEVWAGLGIGPLGDVEFDHIYPLSHNGGYEHLYNYFAMPKELNGSEEFKYYCLLKSEYIGPAIQKDAENFMHWIAHRAVHMIDMSEWELSRLQYSKA